MIEPGTLIDGRYRVSSRIGSGGMAEVYLAEDQLLGRQVAVKLLQHRFAEDQEFVERFRREASSAAGLSHPNVVAIFDRGEWDGTYYIAMEYLPGRSLKAIAREGPLDVADAVDVVIQILRAARFAHRRGIIHRDIKPHNVILDEEGRAKVTDFGIARAGASDMTLTGSIMGTAQYLSPEQAQGHAVSEASDIYAIGIVLYELLTGAIPFDGETAVSIALKQVSAPPPVPSALNPAVPSALDAVVVRALAKVPRERYANADEFIAALELVAQALPRDARTATALTAHGAAMGSGELTAITPPPTALAASGYTDPPTGDLPLAETATDGVRPSRKRRRRRALLILAAFLILAGGAVALLLALRANDVTVPPLRGLTQHEAEARLESAHLFSVVKRVASSTEPDGRVVTSSPLPGTRVAESFTVTIELSSGPGEIKLPDVADETQADAEALLSEAGVKSVHVVEQTSTRVPSGRVIGTQPVALSEVPTGKRVTLLLSKGPPPPVLVSIPEVTGESVAVARTTLQGAGLRLCAISHEPSSEDEPGTVLYQSPEAGERKPQHSCVDVTAASRPTTVTVPDVVGERQARAEAEINAAGLIPFTATETVNTRYYNGRVLSVSPTVGTSVRRATTVTITVGVYEAPEVIPQTTGETTTGATTGATTTGATTSVPTTGPAEVP